MLTPVRALVMALLALSLAACARLTFFAANLPALGADREVDLRYAEGDRGRFDLYSSGTADARGRPLVVFFYGGGFTTGSKADYRFAAAAIAQTGHVVAAPDYRVYPAVRFPVFIEDAAAAVVAAQREAGRLGADTRRVVLVGHSAGAYIAAQLAYEPKWLEAAGGDASSVVGFIGLSGPYDIDPNSGELDEIFRRTGTADDYKPVRHVRRGAPPALLLHGTRDDVVGAYHSERMAEALRAAGASVTLQLYPNRGHADTVASLSVPARRRTDALARISAFLTKLDAAPASSARPAQTRR